MKSRQWMSVVAALVVVALVAVGVAIAADKASEAKCPVCAMKAEAAHSIQWEGGKVEFCSDGCADEFKKDSAQYAAKAHLQMVKTGQLKQTACPLTGKPMNPDATVEVAGVKVELCCNNCKGKIEKAKPDEQVTLLFKDTSKGFKPASSH